MNKLDLKAVVSVDADNINYLSGFWLGSAFFGTLERPAFLILPRDGDAVLLLNEIMTNSVRGAMKDGSCQVREARFYAEHPNTRSEPTRWFDVLMGLLDERSLLGRAGLDVSVRSIPQDLSSGAQGLEFESVEDHLRQMRYVKHKSELELIRLMGRLSDWAQDVFKAHLKIGRACPEVSYLTLAELGKKAVAMYPQDKLELMVFCHAGPDSANIPNAGRYYGRKLEPGDSVINIIICRLNGYVGENERTFLVGAPSDEKARIFETVRQAQWAAVQACTTGNPIAEIDRCTRGVIERAGYGDYIFHRAGHGIGLAGHEYPLDTAFNEQPLMAGAVMSCEPAVYIPGVGGFRHSDTVIVQNRGPELATTYPRDLKSLIV